MRSPLGSVAEDWAELAEVLLGRWSEHASAVAERLDAGGYDADQAAADFATTVSLAADCWVRLAAKGLDAVAILSGSQCQPHKVRSDVFATALAGATLKLAGGLRNGLGSDELPERVVRVDPSALAPGGTEFSLQADATGHRAGTYTGTVEASRAGEVAAVIVWIVVP